MAFVHLPKSDSFVQSLKETGAITILAATHCSSLVADKNKHISRHFGGTEVPHEKEKHLFAFACGGKNILIDGYMDNCISWKEVGGIALLYTYNKEYKYSIQGNSLDNIIAVDSHTDAIESIKVIQTTISQEAA